MSRTAFIIMWLGLALVATFAEKASAECTKDIECKGDRVCVDGQCTSPTPNDDVKSESTATPMVAPAAVSSAPDTVPAADTALASPAPTVITDPSSAPRGPTVLPHADVPKTAGRIGIVTGTVFSDIGIGLLVTGGIMAGFSSSASMGIVYGGSALLTIGSIIGTTSYSYRHGLYERAGFSPRGWPMAGAWALTSLTLGTAGGSIVMAALASSYDNFDLAIGSFCLAGTAAILEIINMGVRGRRWRRALDESASRKQVASPMVPVLYAIPAPKTRELVPMIGLSRRF